MDIPVDEMQSIVAGLILAGDYQELMSVYQTANLAQPVEALSEMYAEGAFDEADQAAFHKIRDAIHVDLLPDLQGRVTVPTEMVELLARCAFERGNETLALRALREADAIDATYQRLSDFAIESLTNADLAQAAFELRLAGRLGWARMDEQSRLDFIVGLGVDSAELAFALGGESNRGRISGCRALPDFPAWQTYTPLLHARCNDDSCVASLTIDDAAPHAVRLLLHDPELAGRALQATGGNALKLLRALVAESDPTFGEYAEAYEKADARFLEIEDITRQENVRREGGQEAKSEDDEPSDLTDEEREEAVGAGLAEVQTFLLGHPEKGWRNCLGQLVANHPLAVYTVCVARARGIGDYVVPVGKNGAAFLESVVS